MNIHRVTEEGDCKVGVKCGCYRRAKHIHAGISTVITVWFNVEPRGVTIIRLNERGSQSVNKKKDRVNMEFHP